MKKFFSVLLSASMACLVSGCALSAKDSGAVLPEAAASEEKTTTVVSADYPEYEDADALVDSADLIFSGTVKGISYEQLDVSDGGKGTYDAASEKLPYTVYEVLVDKVYKGEAEGDVIRIKRLGGRDSDEELGLEDAPAVDAGGEYLFLTQTYDNTYPSLVNMSQAAYSMDDAAKKSQSGGADIALSDIMKVIG